MSGLVRSIKKSSVFFCNVPDHVKSAILGILPFEEGSLPVKYLGVPLISTRLLYKDLRSLLRGWISILVTGRISIYHLQEDAN